MFTGLIVELLFKTAVQTITTKSLVENPFDFPLGSGPTFTQRQFSSGSPTSKTPGNEAWFANDDYGHYLRQEGKEYVMADLKGPGAVVRMWSANPMGTLRMYFDGEPVPRINVPMRDWVQILRGANPTWLNFAFWAGPGWNVYVPFPYRKSLKITMEPDEKENAGGLYYHVGYRTFAAGTDVQTFDGEDLDAKYTVADPAGKTISDSVTLTPGNRTSTMTFNGPGKLSDIHLNWNYGAKDLHKTLRSIWVTASFDGVQTVSAPLGDFMAAPFGHGSKDSMEVHLKFDMPFKKNATFSFDRNTAQSGDAVLMQFTGTRESYSDRDELNYFHADFSRDRAKTRPMRDMHWLNVQGSGYLAGVNLLMDNPSRQWWGEGDEKIYVDGESYPSTFGTGTEDFFNYAWGSPAPYWTPSGDQNYTTTSANSFGYCNVSRFMKMDPIPFSKSLKFDMEMWHWADCVATWDRTVYWYGKAGAKSEGSARPSWRELELPDVKDIRVVPGALEAEKLKYSATSGTTEIQGGFGDMSGDGQIWWQDSAVGGKLTVEVIAADGEYDLTMNACRARDYGIHQLYWNGAKLGEPIDFYDPDLKWQQVKLGKVRVSGGKAIFTAECMGFNAKAVPAKMFGLDYFVLKKL
jgi:hypothetical protein